MSISKKHFKKLVELICNNYDAKTNQINMGFTSELSSYLKEQNNRFDSLTFFNAINEGTKVVVEKQKEFLKNKKDLLKEDKKFNDLIDAHRLLKAENQFHKDCADQYKKSARVLQSKVNTYEADIVKQHKESKEAISLIQQSINDTK